MALTEAQQQQMDQLVVGLAKQADGAGSSTAANELAQAAERIATAAQLLTPQPMLPDWAAADEALAELVGRADLVANDIDSLLTSPPGTALPSIEERLGMLGSLARGLATLGAALRGGR